MRDQTNMALCDIHGLWYCTTAVWIISTYMGSVSVVTTVKWFWFLLSLAALAGVIVALARSFKESSIQRYPEVNPVFVYKIIARLARTHVMERPGNTMKSCCSAFICYMISVE